ncbi:MAG: hypothetical protein IPO40_10525 [Fibrobacteres bacterium]|nr:hypothetical protein [Fibrobacterota bacterium]
MTIKKYPFGPKVKRDESHRLKYSKYYRDVFSSTEGALEKRDIINLCMCLLNAERPIVSRAIDRCYILAETANVEINQIDPFQTDWISELALDSYIIFKAMHLSLDEYSQSDFESIANETAGEIEDLYGISTIEGLAGKSGIFNSLIERAQAIDMDEAINLGKFWLGQLSSDKNINPFVAVGLQYEITFDITNKIRILNGFLKPDDE